MSHRSTRVLWLARIWAFIIIGLHLAAPRLGEPVAWGLWPATFTPAPWRAVLALGAALLGVFGDRLRRMRLLRFDLSAWQVRLGIALAAAVPFYLLRIRHLQWGDANLLIKALGDPYRITYVWQAPLDVFLHARLWQWGHEIFGWPDPTPVYWILSTLAGVAFVYILLSLACTLGRNRIERLLIVGLVATLGTMQLFFGYIENYPIMTVGVLLYAWLGVRTLRGELPILWPATALAITHAFHPSTVILAPSLLYLLWRQGSSPERQKVLQADAIVATRRIAQHPPSRLADSGKSTSSFASARARSHPGAFIGPLLQVMAPYVLVFVGVLALMEGGGHGLTALATVDFPGGGDRKWFVPLFEATTEWQHYTMFSVGHLLDIINQQLLAAPVVWPMLLILALSAGRGLPLRDKTFRFLLIMAVCHLALTLTWNADYGGQKDWDLFSPAAVPAALLLAYTLPRMSLSRAAVRGAATALISAQGFHTVLWVFRNTRP